MRLRKFVPPISILLFLALTLAGTYVVRVRILKNELDAAMMAQDAGGVEAVLKSWPCPVDLRRESGVAILVESASYREPNVTRFCLDAGVDVNGEYYCTTALERAAGYGRTRTIELLIARGAEVNKRDAGGRTALLYAARDGSKATLELLVSKGALVRVFAQDGTTPLHSAAEGGNEETVAVLLSHGADVWARDWRGWTPLHCAAVGYSPEVVQMLIDAGADVNTEDMFRRAPLNWAIRPQVEEQLKKNGAKATDPSKLPVFPID